MPFRILSLDGGGIRGLLAAQMLVVLEERLKVPLTEYFHLMAGTSTGSMLAAAIALGIPTKKIIQLYREKGKIVFPYTSRWTLKRLRLIFEYGPSAPKFSDDGLVELLKELLGEKKLGDLTSPKLMITSYDTIERNPLIFKSWRTKFAQVPLWEACVCSASAPTFFPAHKLEMRYTGVARGGSPNTIALANTAARDDGDYNDMRISIYGGSGKNQSRIIKNYNGRTREATVELPWETVPDNSSLYEVYKQYCAIDGGLAANNPTACAVAEALRLGHRLEDLQVFSIGTGDPTRKILWEDARGWGQLQWIWDGRVVKVMTDAPTKIYDYITDYVIGDPSRYMRLQFPLDRQLTCTTLSDDMDDASEENMNNLVDAADAYMKLPEVAASLTRFVGTDKIEPVQPQQAESEVQCDTGLEEEVKKELKTEM